MKLFRFGDVSCEKTGVILNDQYFDTSFFGEDYNESFFENNGLRRLGEALENENKLQRIPEGTRIASPVARPSKIICIGLNYEDHAIESGALIPSEPVLFLKSTTSLSGPFDNIIIPKNSTKTDWEVELAIIIGKKASYISEETAMDHIAGYCLHNDVSEREFQLERNGTWDKGKGCDSFAPLGPWLVTKDEIADIHNCRIWLKVNNMVRQDSSTANLIFKIPFLIAYISQFMTLLPGDVVSTGTPAGVGLGMNPPVFLKENDVVELGIDFLGISRQKCTAYAKN
jgi:2,4-didehydro-3-deoxy-L-rhamnonate hydrolase